MPVQFHSEFSAEGDRWKCVGGGGQFPTKNMWVPCVPTQSALFAWEATWGKALTLDMLQRRGWQLPNPCFLCSGAKETIHHLLLHCPITRFV